ncbi:MAG: N-acetyltransferase [Psychromonas sp.]
MKICAYNPNDIEPITQLFTDTFTDSEGKEEGQLVGNLANQLLTTTKAEERYAFVAIEHDQIIACIILSKLTFECDINVFLLSPVAVRTSEQKKGVAQKLINFAINALKGEAVQLLFTYGDPNFYNKVGFSPISQEVVKAPFPLTYPEGWLGQSLTEDHMQAINGQSCCADALSNASYW